MSVINTTTTDGPAASAQPRDWRNLGHLFEKLPPHAIEAEMALLGSILIESQVVGDVIQVIRNAEDFYKPANGAIFEVMVELYDTHSSLDIVQLDQALKDRKTLDAVGGVDYLLDLANAVPSAANALHYARLVREKAKIRQLITAAGDILYDAYHAADNAQAILDQAEAKIFHIAEQSETSSIESLHSLIEHTLKVLEESEGKHITGVPTGFVELDEMTGGLQNGEMVIVAARPSMGKTALALNMAEQIGLRDIPVGFFSLEMSRQQLVQRLLSSCSGVDLQRIRRNMLKDQEWTPFYEACGRLQKAPIFIDDTPGLSLMQLRAKARRMASKHQIKILFIDYLQLMSSGMRVESRQQEVSEISRGIKSLARELNVPVVCLSQLNRATETRHGHRPLMSDLRESGSIEQDADVVTMLHREEYYHINDPDWADENPDKVGLTELIITKQRNGPTGVVNLTWIATSTRFRDHAPAREHGAGYGSNVSPAAMNTSAPLPTTPSIDTVDGLEI